MIEVVAPLQTITLEGAVTIGVGFTVIVNVFEDPIQVTPLIVLVGVTVIVAVIGAFEEFVAVKTGILPIPVAGRPIAVLSFAHE